MISFFGVLANSAGYAITGATRNGEPTIRKIRVKKRNLERTTTAIEIGTEAGRSVQASALRLRAIFIEHWESEIHIS
jgi:hypothetical protein